jgi:hypothetical protein
MRFANKYRVCCSRCVEERDRAAASAFSGFLVSALGILTYIYIYNYLMREKSHLK